MEQAAALQTVTRHLVEQFDIAEDRVTLEAHLFDDLELDSIDALDMVGILENELGIDIEVKEVREIRTVGDVVAFVLKHT